MIKTALSHDMLVSSQFSAFSLTVLAGLCMGLAYDFSRVFMTLIKSSRWHQTIFDLFFWFLMAVAVFYILLLANKGEVRAYVFLGLGLGGTVYAALFSRWIYSTTLLMAKRLLKVVCFLITPFLKIFQVTRQTAQTFKKYSKIFFRKASSLLVKNNKH